MSQQQSTIMQEMHPSPKFWRVFFFIWGIIATIAYRIIFLLDPFWVKVVWYIGTIGFMLYFGHRSHIEHKRAELVKKYGLVETIEGSDIQEDKKMALSYLIQTSLTSKARFNSAFIFVSSLVVFVMSIVLDLYNYFR